MGRQIHVAANIVIRPGRSGNSNPLIAPPCRPLNVPPGTGVSETAGRQIDHEFPQNFGAPVASPFALRVLPSAKSGIARYGSIGPIDLIELVNSGPVRHLGRGAQWFARAHC
jgi:hypothetical protein